MKLNDIEKEWYDKLSELGMSNYDANFMARLKFLIEEYKRIQDDDIVDFEGFVNLNGSFYQFCIDSGRLTSDEINLFYHNVYRSLHPYDDFFSTHYDYGRLWRFFKNIFK